MLKQVSVFAENKPGRVSAILEVLKKAEINVRAMTIAETIEFGIVRLIVSEPEKAKSLLQVSGFTVNTTDVIGITIPDRFGAFYDAVRILGENNINIEYSYSLMGCSHGKAEQEISPKGGLCPSDGRVLTTDKANILIRVKDTIAAERVLRDSEVKMFTQGDII
jgi:hypothetical protein